MGIQRQIWNSHLVENYWKNNSFLKKAVQVDKDSIYGGKIVHIPVVNGRPEVVLNATSFPIDPVDRPDTDILYKIDEHFVKPFRIKNAEKYELSYDKRQSCIGEQSAAANQSAAEQTLFRWQKYTQINDDGNSSTMLANLIKTTGANSAGYLPGSVGTRKNATVADFGKIRVAMRSADLPDDGEYYCCVDSNMLDQVTQDEDYKKTYKSFEDSLITGAVAKIKGFWIFERSSVSRFTNDTTPAIYAPQTNPVGGSDEEEDQNAAALFWHASSVETAVGEVEFFDNPKRAEHYGDIFSALLRAGGRMRRKAGVYSLVQSH